MTSARLTRSQPVGLGSLTGDGRRGVEPNVDPGGWPLPSPFYLCLFAVGTFAASIFLGAKGLAAVFAIGLLLPSQLWGLKNRRQPLGDSLLVLSVALFLNNIDALGDVLGSEKFRWSYLIVGMCVGALVVAGRQPSRTVYPYLISLLGFLGYQSINGLRVDNVFAIEHFVNQGLCAIALFTCLSIPRARQHLVFRMAICGAIHTGFLVFELIVPYNEVSISSARLDQLHRVIRGASLYANSNDCAAMIASALLFCCIGCCCRRTKKADQHSLIFLCLIMGIGALLTFSRSGVAAFVLATIAVVYVLGESIISKVLTRLLIVACLLSIAFIATIAAVGKDNLGRDAVARLDNMTGLISGDLDAVDHLLDARRGAWFGNRELNSLTPLGLGYNYLIKHRRNLPHNMLGIIAIEDGIVGVSLYVAMCIFFCFSGNGHRYHRIFSLVALGVLVSVLMRTHIVLNRRFFLILIANPMMIGQLAPSLVQSYGSWLKSSLTPRVAAQPFR